MKTITLFLVFTLYSLTVFAETTVELVQQRAEGGDSTAQALMGLMSYNGYGVPRDRVAALEWYERAANQNHVYAEKMAAKLKTNAESTKESLPVGDNGRSSSLPAKEVSADKDSSAGSVEYAGDVELSRLALKREEYVGKVVRLSFMSPFKLRDPVRGSSSFSIFSKNYEGVSDSLSLSGQDALKWAMAEAKRGHGATHTVYVIVEEHKLIALGDHQSKVDNGYTYSW